MPPIYNVTVLLICLFVGSTRSSLNSDDLQLSPRQQLFKFSLSPTPLSKYPLQINTTRAMPFFHLFHHRQCHYFITCAHDLDSMNGIEIHCTRCKRVLLAEDATIATYPSSKPFLKHTSPNCTLSTEMQCTQPSPVICYNPSTLHSIH